MENPINNDPNAMSCREFQDRLGEAVASGFDAKSHPHLQTCDICRALVREVDVVATEAIVAEVVRRRRFGDDEGPESGAPAVPPKVPKLGLGSAKAALDSDAE
jgi:hypothetical protein